VDLAYLAVEERSATRSAQSLVRLLLAILGQLLKLHALGLATVPIGIGVLLPGLAVTAPALAGIGLLCQRHCASLLGPFRLVAWLSSQVASSWSVHRQLDRALLEALSGAR
jgi:hypothetical protein